MEKRGFVKLAEEVQEETLPLVGKKLDAGKLMYSLLPWDAVTEVTKVLMYGAFQKPLPDGTFGYGEANYLLVPDLKRRYYDAALRHLTSWYYGGEIIDPDTKEYQLRHLAEAGCCVLFLLAAELRGRLDGNGPRE